MLETFYEERSTNSKQEPYINQSVDGVCNGRPPAIWDVQLEPPNLFYETEIQQEVPHTASIIVSISESKCKKGKGVPLLLDINIRSIFIVVLF